MAELTREDIKRFKSDGLNDNDIIINVVIGVLHFIGFLVLAIGVIALASRLNGQDKFIK